MKQFCVTVSVSFWSGLLGSTGFVRKFLCTPCICGRPAEVQPRPDARFFFCCRVMMEHAVDVDRYLLRSDFSPALDVTQRHTDTPVLN